MYYISVANQSHPPYVENHDLKINFNDLGTVAAIVIALLSMFSKNTKSQAKELDHETFEKTSKKMERLWIWTSSSSSYDLVISVI